MLFGLSIGLAVALVVYLRAERPRLAAPLAAREIAPATISPEFSPPADSASTEVAKPDVDAGVAEESRENPANDQSDFVFYEQLRNSEVIIPESALAERAEALEQDYVIQAGSFPEVAGADRMKANLALLGIESHIEPTIIGSDIYHRVIIGPLRGRANINRVVRRLREASIDPLPPRPVLN